MGRNNRQKQKDKLAYIKINPILPTKFSEQERVKLREFETKIMTSKGKEEEKKSKYVLDSVFPSKEMMDIALQVNGEKEER